MSRKPVSPDPLDADPQETSRRQFLMITGTSLAALSSLAAGCSDSADQVNATAGAASPAAKKSAPTAPFDSIRDYVAALWRRMVC